MKLINNSRCIVCGKIIYFTTPLRKCCRGTTCKNLFYKLKKLHYKGVIGNLPENELKIYKTLLKNGEFIKNRNKEYTLYTYE